MLLIRAWPGLVVGVVLGAAGAWLVGTTRAGAAWGVPARLSAREAEAAAAGWVARARAGADTPAEAELTTALRVLVTVLPAEQFPGLLDECQRVAEQRWWRLVFQAWCERSPEVAARWALERPWESAEAPESVGAALATWARRDPAAAWRWADARLSRGGRWRLLEDLVVYHPATALALAREAGDVFVESGAVTRPADAFARWADSDPAAAVRGLGAMWAETGQGERLAQRALWRWLEVDPAAALAWVQAHRNAAGHSLFYRGPFEWEGSRATALADQLMQGQVSVAQTAMLEEFVAAWAQLDTRAVRAWLGTLPEGPRRHGLVRHLLARSVMSWAPPAEALALVAELPEAAERDRHRAALVATWGASLAAEAALTAGVVPPEAPADAPVRRQRGPDRGAGRE